MGIGMGIAEFAADFLGRASSLRDGIAVGCMVILACCLLIDFFAESGDRKEGDAALGEGGDGGHGRPDPAPYEELQKLTSVELVVLERDFLVPKAFLRRQRRIRAALVGAVAGISLLAVLYASSWRWVMTASVLYLVVVGGTVWAAPRFHRRKADGRRRPARRWRGEG